MYWLEFYIWGEQDRHQRFKLPFASEEKAADYVHEHRHDIRKHSLQPGGIDG